MFISYARANTKVVVPMVRLLRAAGTRVFIDTESIAYGQRWEQVILQALASASRVLVFWSREAAASEWVRREYTMALNRAGIPIVPVLLDETPLPAELAKFQALTELGPLVERARVLASSRSSLLWALRLVGISWVLTVLPISVLPADGGGPDLSLCGPIVSLGLVTCVLAIRRHKRQALARAVQSYLLQPLWGVQA